MGIVVRFALFALAIIAVLILFPVAPKPSAALKQPDAASVEIRYASRSAAHPGSEGVQYLNLDEFVAEGRASFWRGAGFKGEEPVRVALLKREEDGETAGNLLLKFAVAAEGEVFDIPEVSWSRHSELLLSSGDGWLVKLVPGKRDIE